MVNALTVIYTSKLEDGTIIERKGSEEEPFEFTTQEGIYGISLTYEAEEIVLVPFFFFLKCFNRIFL